MKILKILILLGFILLPAACGKNNTKGNNNTNVEENGHEVETDGGGLLQPPQNTEPGTGEVEFEEIEDITPLLWRVWSPPVEGEAGNFIYIFGSMPFGGIEVFFFPDYVMDAFNSSNILAVEVDIVDFEMDFDAILEHTFLLMYVDDTFIYDYIDEELYEHALSVLDELGVDADYLNIYRPLMWAMTLESIAAERAFLGREFSVDNFFIFSALGSKPILQAMNEFNRLDIMLNLSYPLHSARLYNALNVERQTLYLRRLYEAWMRGNIDVIRETVYLLEEGSIADERLAAEYAAVLSRMRDEILAQSVRQYIENGMGVFYVMHLTNLLGTGGVLDLLESEGFIVERVMPE